MDALGPWVDVSMLEDALTVGGGVDVDVPLLSGVDFALTPSISVSYAF